MLVNYGNQNAGICIYWNSCCGGVVCSTSLAVVDIKRNGNCQFLQNETFPMNILHFMCLKWMCDRIQRLTLMTTWMRPCTQNGMAFLLHLWADCRYAININCKILFWSGRRFAIVARAVAAAATNQSIRTTKSRDLRFHPSWRIKFYCRVRVDIFLWHFIDSLFEMIKRNASYTFN